MDNILSVKGLSYSYTDGTEALDGISLTLGRGERLAIVGGNGAGKTTLLLHLNGILRGDGVITVDGLTLNKGNINAIRRKVGLLFPDPDDQLFMPTVLQDVAFGLLNAGLPADEAKLKAYRALDDLNASELAEREPRRLSRGEKKRVALAAVLALKPEVLAMDEPASGLDPGGRRDVIGIIKELDASIIIATHDLELALELCGWALLLGGGRVIAEGEPDEIFGNKRLMSGNGLEVPYSLSV
jgi:cobalt/nickel transport system ATP-binding protein